jgi:hypothetical protein
MRNNELKNNLIKMFNTNKESTSIEIDRLGSISQRDSRYRRNGMLNFGASQMMSIVDLNFFSIGGGGKPNAGA